MSFIEEEQRKFFKYNIVGEIVKLLVAICSETTICSKELLCGKGLDTMEEIRKKIKELQQEIVILNDMKVDKTTKVNTYELKQDVNLDAEDVGVNYVKNSDINDLFNN